MTAERLDSFVPVETVPLPRPLHRFGSAFPLGLAEVKVSRHVAVGRPHGDVSRAGGLEVEDVEQVLQGVEDGAVLKGGHPSDHIRLR